MNKQKPKISSSKNINHNIAKQLSKELGVSWTADLEKYLGVPLPHNNVLKSTEKDIVEKVHKRITSWSAKTLALTRSITLSKQGENFGKGIF